jgi:hypothetical protein
MSDFSKLMTQYRKWHLEFAPKLEFEYFMKRVRKMGSNKTVADHMNKLRQVYK